MTSARVFIHPRCLAGQAQVALEAGLTIRGVALDTVCIGPPTPHGNFELMRLVGKRDGGVELERMDGTRFFHKTKCAVEPEVA